MPRLLVKEGRHQPIEVPVERFPFRVGREPDNHLVLNDEAVSGYHFQLKRKGRHYYLEDLGSRNGTFLNKNPGRIKSAALDDGAQIIVGRSTIMSFRTEAKRPGTGGGPPQRASVVSDQLRSMTTSLTTSLSTMVKAEALERGGSSQPPRTRVISLAPPDASGQAGLAQVAAAYERLAALYDATGYIIGGIDDLDACLENVLDSAIQVLNAERGFIMLRDRATSTLEVKVARSLNLSTPEGRGSMGIAERVAETGEPLVTANAAEDYKAHDSVVMQNIRSVVCAPLQVEVEAAVVDIGVLYLDVLSEGKVFTSEDKDLLAAFGCLAAMAIHNARLFDQVKHEERLRNQMARNLPHQLVDVIIDAGEEWGPGGDEQAVTILSSDIRGFTPLSERLSPQQTLELLNYYFGEMTEVVFDFEGTLDKFMGDGLMAIFGAPYTREDDALRAVHCAMAMVRRMDAINVELPRRGLPTLAIGIALNTGVAVVGNVGSSRRMDYTAVGDMVNVAFRVTDKAIPNTDAGEYGSILLTETTYREVADAVQAKPIGEQRLKGKQEPLGLYRVIMPAETAVGAPDPSTHVTRAYGSMES